MSPFRRPAAAALIGAAALTLAACGGVTAPGTGSVVTPAASASELSGVYGTCDGVPAAEMAGLPVVEALARSPRLSTLSAALTGLPALTDALTGEPALTVFAPSDDAFERVRAQLGEPAYDALLADQERLDGLLSYHVTQKRLDAEQLAVAGKTTGLAHGDLEVGGTAEALTLTSTAGTTAGVVCGNVQTANATIFVVDAVLLPAT